MTFYLWYFLRDIDDVIDYIFHYYRDIIFIDYFNTAHTDTEDSPTRHTLLPTAFSVTHASFSMFLYYYHRLYIAFALKSNTIIIGYFLSPNIYFYRLKAPWAYFRSRFHCFHLLLLPNAASWESTLPTFTLKIYFISSSRIFKIRLFLRYFRVEGLWWWYGMKWKVSWYAIFAGDSAAVTAANTHYML